MADSLNHIIDTLKRTTIISSQPTCFETLNSIDKLGDNDFDKAYLLGHFFKYKVDSDSLPVETKTLLIDTIKRNNLDTYYYLKAKPDGDNFGKLIYLFMLIGLIAIIAGTIQLSNGNYSYGLGTKYLVPILREGGYKMILGLIFFVGGLIRFRHQIRKRQFLKSFLTPTNNSN
jgi:hypothetical protein